MKLCKHCHTEQPEEAFALAGIVKGKMYRRQQCNKCKKAREALRIATIEAWLRDYKKTKCCVRCGFDKFPALAFHHLNREEKEFNVSQMGHLGHGLASIQREMAKCIVLCFNCHRIAHAEEWAAEAATSSLVPAPAALTLTDALEQGQQLTGFRKVCRYCRVEQDESCFEVCKVVAGKAYRRHKCRRCKRATQNRRRHRLRDWLETLKKSLRCTECGFDDFRALEFHHPDGEEKDFAIGEMLKDNRSIAAVEREIRKCIVLCANCHRILHYDEYEVVRSEVQIPGLIGGLLLGPR